MQYAIIGAGGTGGVVGYFMTKAGKDVTLIARGRHLEAMKEHGLTLERLWDPNPETIAAGKTALRIICAGFLVSSVSVTACGALEGLGRGTASLVVSLCRYLIIILPAAFILSRILGAVGVWHAFWIAEALTAGVAFFISQKVIGV